ncbi:hypothetical protein L3073_14465 [Ancylomarina sp. DW003]|nr:hypothetical protein [Ancylomarina sp. DW003]MDE5423419.1 hypothetical protein [Ancylomarina sp. DW003]
MEKIDLKLESLKSYFVEKGFLEANIDSTYILKDTLFAIFHLGKKYQWKNLEVRVDKRLDRNNLKINKPNAYSFTEGVEKQFLVLDSYLNNGYPFAAISISDLKINGGELDGICSLQSNQKIVWDSMIIKGDIQLHDGFIQTYLDIKPGQAYSENKFEEISTLIENLDFVSEIKPSEVEFFDSLAKIHHYFKKQAANRFDGIVGFQNNKKTDKLELTGEVNLALINSFRRGERILINWKKLEENSQNLQVRFQYPYLFNTKVGLNFNFHLLKQDSSYLNTNLKLGLSFKQKKNSSLKLFYHLKSSNLISTKQYAGATVLPDFADSKSNLLGFQYNYVNLDRLHNSRKGWNLKLEIAGGENEIDKNSNFQDELYRGIDLKTKIFEGKINLKNFIPIRSKWVYNWQVVGALMERVNYFENELYRLGGLKSIRGFNEDAFRASKYLIAKEEFGFVSSRNTKLYLFYDWAWYEQEIQSLKTSDHLMGYGFGFNFSAGSGLFSLNYALGRQGNETTDLKSAKIHFGFVAKF